MAVDLHTHSSFSDGTETPEWIVGEASRLGLRAVALTDHDTLEGIPRARAAAAAAGMELVAGVELSVSWSGRAMHLLAYWIEPGSGPLQDRLGELQHSRSSRNLEIIAVLNDLGVEISAADVARETTEGVVGRPHIAAALVRKGVVDSIPAAFDTYLASGRPAYRPRLRLDAAEAVRLAKESGGATSVAHPHTIADRAEAFDAAFAELGALGIDGVECHYAEYPRRTRKRLQAAARARGLVPTGGSDFHGAHKPGIALGTGRGDLVVPDEALDELAARRR